MTGGAAPNRTRPHVFFGLLMYLEGRNPRTSSFYRLLTPSWSLRLARLQVEFLMLEAAVLLEAIGNLAVSYLRVLHEQTSTRQSFPTVYFRRAIHFHSFFALFKAFLSISSLLVSLTNAIDLAILLT